jgi:hypothetical protein
VTVLELRIVQRTAGGEVLWFVLQGDPGWGEGEGADILWPRVQSSYVCRLARSELIEVSDGWYGRNIIKDRSSGGYRGGGRGEPWEPLLRRPLLPLEPLVGRLPLEGWESLEPGGGRSRIKPGRSRFRVEPGRSRFRIEPGRFGGLSGDE